MTDPDATSSAPAQFKVLCCKARRSLLPSSGVLVCLSCDAGLHVPKGVEFVEVPAGETRWPPSA